MKATTYHRHLTTIIESNPAVVASEISFREIDENECYIRGILHLSGGYSIHIAEYVITEPEPPRRLKYRYQLQDADGMQIARWDNAPHHRDLETFPDHRHDASNMAHPSPPMNLQSVLAEALLIVSG